MLVEDPLTGGGGLVRDRLLERAAADGELGGVDRGEHRRDDPADERERDEHEQGEAERAHGRPPRVDGRGTRAAPRGSDRVVFGAARCPGG